MVLEAVGGYRQVQGSRAGVRLCFMHDQGTSSRIASEKLRLKEDSQSSAHVLVTHDSGAPSGLCLPLPIYVPVR